MLTLALLQQREILGLPTDLMLFFTLVVGTAIVGGLLPSLVCAVLASSLLNYFFTEPTGGLTIDEPEQALAVVLFALVAVAVASVVDLAERRSVQAREAQAEAAALAELSRTVMAEARELEHGNAVRTALLTAASHDLRTPLAAIRASVDVLGAAGRPGHAVLLAEDRAVLDETIDTATARLERLVDDLLDLSMLHTGAVRPELRPVSLEEVVPLALEGTGAGRVDLDVAESLPLILTDPGLLERVVANLVSNAVRFAPPGSPVTVAAHATADEVVLRVVDTGPGVPPASRERMFDAFERLGEPSGRADPRTGLGLGLAVARGLSDAVGAHLEARDTEGGGLTMVLTVPRARPERLLQHGAGT